MKVAFELTPEQAEKLQREAERLGIPPADLAKAALADLLAARDGGFPRGRRARADEKPRALSPTRLMRYLTLGEVVELHQGVLAKTGGAPGIRDLGLLESALAQPKATFGSEDLHPNLTDKAAALGFSLVANPPFVDGNKRVGHAAMEVFLILNG